MDRVENTVPLFLCLCYMRNHRRGPRRKHRSSVSVPLLHAQPSARTVEKTPFLCCCLRVITWQRLLYGCLLRGRCLTTGLHATLWYRFVSLSLKISLWYWQYYQLRVPEKRKLVLFSSLWYQKLRILSFKFLTEDVIRLRKKFFCSKT
jgi:hypothetical protein